MTRTHRLGDPDSRLAGGTDRSGGPHRRVRWPGQTGWGDLDSHRGGGQTGQVTQTDPWGHLIEGGVPGSASGVVVIRQAVKKRFKNNA